MSSPQEPILLLPDGDEAGTPPEDRAFRPDVQGLRAIAVALVVLYHAKFPLLTGGFVGVDVFFVISGFVITGVLLRERAAKGTTSLGEFYARRARRILPAATLVLLTTVLAVYHFQGFLRGDEVAIDGRWTAVFLANYHAIVVGNDYFGAQGTITPLLHFWSLAVEEQFYLVFPLAFMAIAAGVALRFRHRVLAVVLGLVIVSSFALSVVQTNSSPVTAFFSPFTRAWELALGALVAVAAPLLRKLPQGIAASATWLGLLGIVIAATAFTGSTPWPGSAVALPVLATALVIAGGVVAPRFGAEMVLGMRPFLLGGEISYALYLWHFPILVLAFQQTARAGGVPLGIVSRGLLVLLAVVLAVGTNLLVENPVRRARVLVASRRLSLVLGASLISGTLIVCTVMIDIHRGPSHASPLPGPSAPSVATLRAQVTGAASATQAPDVLAPPLINIPSTPLHPAAISNECVGAVQNMATLHPCVFGDPHGSLTVALLGDSQAMTWSNAFLGAATRGHWRLVVLGLDGCPPWLIGSQAQTTCGAFHRYAHKVLAELHPNVVVVTGAETGSVPVAADERGLVALARSIKGLGASPIVLGSIPWWAGAWTGPEPAECIAEQPASLKGCNLPVSVLEHSYGAFHTALRNGAAQTGSAYVDVQPLFCTASSCPVIVNHRVVAQGRFHLTSLYSGYLSRAIGELLSPALVRQSKS